MGIAVFHILLLKFTPLIDRHGLNNSKQAQHEVIIQQFIIRIDSSLFLEVWEAMMLVENAEFVSIPLSSSICKDILRGSYV